MRLWEYVKHKQERQRKGNLPRRSENSAVKCELIKVALTLKITILGQERATIERIKQFTETFARKPKDKSNMDPIEVDYDGLEPDLLIEV